MLLKNLIKDIPEDKKKINISGLSMNSKEIRKNYIFFAIKGNKFNGEKFIDEAIKKGASVIVCSNTCKISNINTLVIKTNNVRYLLSEIASKFYRLKPKNIIAVTGTNGKTSVADLFYQILRINNIPVATIGTLGIKYNGKIKKTNLTSPDTIALHKNLYYLKMKKIDHVIIETSSHGLHQKRLHHINFKAAIFTNFSQDHLDYHKTMKSYLNAKLTLFREVLKQKSLIISDSKIMPFQILKKIAKKRNLKLIDINNNYKRFMNFSNYLKSDFKIRNLTMAVEAVKLSGLKEKFVHRSLGKIKDVNGRLELVKRYPDNVKVFIDYAHTPDALSKALQSIKDYYGKNISIVFGCGGDRDKKKRPLMAKVADEFCKKIYITDDNPRSENPRKIRSELYKNITKNKAFNIGNRTLAIKKAIHNADPQEIILIAGKGHEELQVYKNKILKISDKKTVKKINKKYRNLSKRELYFSDNRLLLKNILGKFEHVNFDNLSIDSRKIKKNNLFLTIKGKTNDGNTFINHALKKGAGCIISSSTEKIKNKKIIKVKDTISFLNKFAKLKREHTLAKIIAITGSAGKTSLKKLIGDLLNNFGKTHSSPRSFNNYLGVPISLSNLNFDDKYGVLK